MTISELIDALVDAESEVGGETTVYVHSTGKDVDIVAVESKGDHVVIAVD